MPVSDASSFLGAQALAEKVRSYWIRQGYTKVVVTAELVVKPHGEGTALPIYGVRSNLVRGFPPK